MVRMPGRIQETLRNFTHPGSHRASDNDLQKGSGLGGESSKFSRYHVSVSVQKMVLGDRILPLLQLWCHVSSKASRHLTATPCGPPWPAIAVRSQASNVLSQAGFSIRDDELTWLWLKPWTWGTANKLSTFFWYLMVFVFVCVCVISAIFWG
jgi:hypothetical protein